MCGEAFSVHDLFVPPVGHGDSLAGILPGGNEALTVGIHSPHFIDEDEVDNYARLVTPLTFMRG